MTRDPSLFNYLHRTTPDLVQSDFYGKPAIRMDIFSRFLQYFMKFVRFRCRFTFIANFPPLSILTFFMQILLFDECIGIRVAGTSLYFIFYN